MSLAKRILGKIKKTAKEKFGDKKRIVTDTYSPFGIPGDSFVTTKERVKVIIDPSRKYFGAQMRADLKNYSKTLMIHGCETPDLNDIKNELIAHGDKFTKVYSFDPDVLKKVKGSELFCFGSCWVATGAGGTPVRMKKDYKNTFRTDKKFKLSFIRSSKKELPGHKLRYEAESLFSKDFQFELLFPRERIETKIPLFTDSMFHVVIENSRYENYFTEKIIDCFMSFTIPLYWGCPNIADYFDRDGIIIFSTKEELENILNTLTPEEYTKRLDAVKRNYETAKEKYAFFFDRVNEYIYKL